VRATAEIEDDVLAEEIAIWAVVGLAVLLVAAMLWRDDGLPKIQSGGHQHSVEIYRPSTDEAAFDLKGNFQDRIGISRVIEIPVDERAGRKHEYNGG
jgi:hypothetical protein